MADKMTCPACESHTSGMLSAFREGLPCPYCALPHEAAVAVLAAQQRAADEQLIARYMAAEKRAANAEQELGQLRRQLNGIRQILRDDTPT